MNSEKVLRNISLALAFLGMIYMVGVLLGGFTTPNYWEGIGINESYVQDLLTTSPVESTARWAYTFFCISFLTTVLSKFLVWWESHLE